LNDKISLCAVIFMDISMPKILKKVLGFLLLVTTILLATCNSMVKAEPVVMTNSVSCLPVSQS